MIFAGKPNIVEIPKRLEKKSVLFLLSPDLGLMGNQNLSFKLRILTVSINPHLIFFHEWYFRAYP